MALLALKAAIDDDASGALRSWNETMHYCRSIILQNNSIRGQIPEEIGRLRRLEYLEFSNNSFGGTVFPELGSLSKLEALGLSRNRLSGTIPPSIGNLTLLNRLSLVDCGLEGQIPGSLVQLQRLILLQLAGNRLTGHIPSGLFNISTIFIFAVRSNRLEGTIPPDVAFTLPNVRNLDLGENQFTGEIPSSLSNASSLTAINLSSNNFTGPMMNNFERLTNLEYFFLSGNNFWSDFSFISSLTNCTSLQVLAVSQNLLNGSLPDSIANLSSQLTYLSLDSNQIHGSIPFGIEKLLNLTYLNLGNNYLSGLIPSSIGKLVKLQELNLEANRFTNDIPPSLGNLTLLNHLYLGYNNISGNLPQSFSNYRNLLTFDLSHNNLNGPIPPEVGLLRNLADLDLSNNMLSGFIPNTWSTCVSLQRLHLEGNSFDGEIPEGISALSGLQDLDLSRNNLSGPVPSFLADLRLLSLNLSFNRLQGEVPSSGVFKNRSAISIDGNNDLCGVVVGSLFFILMGFVYVFVHKRRTLAKSRTSMESFKGQFMRLSYRDLLQATDGFSEANLIGAGRFGSVYKGILTDGETMVAVKVLNLNVKGASKSFMAECNALRGIRHRNLLKILSICSSTDFQEEESEQDENRRNLTMIQRLNIAIDIASALEYLHFGNDTTIIHGDMKPSNILLDDDMTAHVGDFGLAKAISNLSKDLPANGSSSAAIKGTVGCIAPEYGMMDMVSTQGDSLTSRVTDIADPFLLQELDINDPKRECMVSVLTIGVACSEELPRDRMSMTDAVNELKKLRMSLVERRS
ncbi:UNVERIFIED_CONTAM: putative LRR receptor-like serine/threonine-protein kinase [Sesamum calycinum]|uniref:LRR receptor-like serine/threonine-protein kinase n=1 Tax=Sesamum calycinum TaxID=2727403 RepID=A0AAW2P8H6_9LAMI